MSTHIYGPSGGAVPTRPDSKMSREDQRIHTGNGTSKAHQNAWRKLLKQHATKVRRRRDKFIPKD